MTTTVGNSSGRISDVRSTSGLQHDVEGGCRCWGTKLPFIDASIFPFVQFGVSSLILPVVTHLSQCTHPSALDHHSNAFALAQAESAKVICASLTIHAHILLTFFLFVFFSLFFFFLFFFFSFCLFFLIIVFFCFLFFFVCFYVFVLFFRFVFFSLFFFCFFFFFL